MSPSASQRDGCGSMHYRWTAAAAAIMILVMLVVSPGGADAWPLRPPARRTSERRAIRRRGRSTLQHSCRLRLCMVQTMERSRTRTAVLLLVSAARQITNDDDIEVGLTGDANKDDPNPVNGWGMIPPSFQRKPESKESLYSSNELMQLLDLHTKLAESTFAETTIAAASNDAVKTDKDSASFRSLHDLVVQATAGADSLSSSPWASIEPTSLVTLPPDVRERLQHAEVIATDVDGTLLTSSAPASMHPRACQALRRALRAVQDPNHPLKHLCLATGKTRSGALLSLSRADPELGRDLEMVPGVFVQGLYCVDGRSGRVLYDRRLEASAVLALEGLATEDPALRETSTLFCYRCDDIYYTPSWSQPHHVRELHDAWGEPPPIAVESMEALISNPSGGGRHDDDRRCHKLLIMDSDTNRLAARIRPAAEDIARRHGCVVTQANPTMIELLPPNSSKAVGVRQLCTALGIHSTADDDTIQGLVAIGDAENDVEMLHMASVGFAVGNAVPEAKKAADVALVETNNDGGAGAAIELVLEHLQPTKSPGTFIIS